MKILLNYKPVTFDNYYYLQKTKEQARTWAPKVHSWSHGSPTMSKIYNVYTL